MTELARIIAKEIRETGRMPVSRFMALALGHPQHGYYITRDPLGTDFTTSPEISQMFGELIGAWAADIWAQLGRPDTVHLVELGPGRGTLMADALRAASAQPGFAGATHIAMIETSPVLRDTQQRTVAPIAQAKGFAPPSWHTSIDALPDGPLIVIANEFFDALPIRQFVATDDGWRERCVAEHNNRLVFVPGASLLPSIALPPDALNADPGSILETCPAGAAIAQRLAQRINAHTGAALIIDYGHTKSAVGDTLQAMRNGAFVPVLETPGQADITAHVDFETLAGAARPATIVHRPTTQGDFLLALGIAQRAAALAQNASAQNADAINAAATRLTAADAMGTLFKVMAITSPGLMPAGFPAGF
ncbi:SAM-dependent methyltransferase [Pyruvatibacter sp.]|uniref:class I SAM-dependent methyltransferase n=1 Tax=Pyruvatibacter sp. TaxID=1981328 RepID=UPI0032EEAA28